MAAGLIALALARIALPDGAHGFKLLACLGCVLSALLLGLVSLAKSHGSVYDLWARAWLVVPAAVALFWLTRERIRAWSRGLLDASGAQAGLAGNRRIAPRLRSIATHTLLLPGVALVVVPAVWILDVSVSPGNALGGTIGDAFTLTHFTTVLAGESFWIWTQNSFIVSVGTTGLGPSFAVPAGYAFSRFNFSGRKVSMFAFMVIQMFPGVIILVPYFMVIKTLGLLNTSLGLILAYSVTALPLCVWRLKGFY